MIIEYYDTILGFEKAFKNIRAEIPQGQKLATLETVLSLWIELVYENMGGTMILRCKIRKKALEKSIGGDHVIIK